MNNLILKNSTHMQDQGFIANVIIMITTLDNDMMLHTLIFLLNMNTNFYFSSTAHFIRYFSPRTTIHYNYYSPTHFP